MQILRMSFQASQVFHFNTTNTAGKLSKGQMWILIMSICIFLMVKVFHTDKTLPFACITNWGYSFLRNESIKISCNSKWCSLRFCSFIFIRCPLFYYYIIFGLFGTTVFSRSFNRKPCTVLECCCKEVKFFNSIPQTLHGSFSKVRCEFW